MKARSLVLSLAWCIATTGLAVAADPLIGTWTLNEAKSKLAPGGPKNHTVIYAAEGDSVKVTVEGTAADGSTVRSEWTGKFDGKDYPVTGDPAADMRSYTRVDDHTLSMTNKKDGKTVMTGRIRASADGKTRTVTTSRTDSTGKAVSATAVYDKQ
jgi:hypothetical protein